MAKIRYIDRKFSTGSLATIAKACEICESYMRQGFRLTVRQLYYQFVSRGLIANRVTEYKRLASVVADARMAGLMDWDWIEDRMRVVSEQSHWDSPKQIIGAVARQYRIDKWEGQPYRPVVLIEKDALAGVIEPTCRELDTPYLACRGYTSVSAMKEMADRIMGYVDSGQVPVVLHLGDHDPSGIDMTRDIKDRLEVFLGDELRLDRLALNMDQVDQYNPPPNPAKDTDARFAGYVDLYGDESWELDALEPSVIAALVENAILNLRDEDKWDEMIERENDEKKNLKLAETHWAKVAEFVGSL